MSDKYFVIAGNRFEHDVFAKKKCEEMYYEGNTSMTLSHFIYVSDISSLKGYSNPCGWFIGSWRERKDIKDILQQLMLAKVGYDEPKEFTKVCGEFGFYI